MRVLLVEDDKVTAQIVQDALEQEGYAIDHYENEKKAEIEFFANEGAYSLVIIDIILPDSDGLTLCKTIRQKNKNVPIMFLTSKKETEDVVEGFQIGADDYLTKPFSPKELVARTKALHKRVDKRVVETIDAGHVSLDRDAKKVYYKKKEVDLTGLEYRLLELLLLSKGKIVTRTEILEKVWDRNGEDILSNAIDVHIRSLRKKLHSTKKNPLIVTKRGIGYYIKDNSAKND